MNNIRPLQFNHPLWIFVCLILPQGIWCALAYFDFLAMEAFFEEENHDAWIRLALYLGGGMSFFGVVAGVQWLRRRPLPGLILAPLILIVYLALLAGLLDYDGRLYPFRIPPWAVDHDNFWRYQYTFLMPALLYALLLGVEALTPPGRKHPLWLNALLAVVLPVAVYVLFHVPRLLNFFSDSIPNVYGYVYALFLISSVVLFFFFVFRFFYLLSMRLREPGTTGANFLSLLTVPLYGLLTLVLPLGGLLLNDNRMVPELNSAQVLGDFSHPAFYVLALLNGLLLTLPARKLAELASPNLALPLRGGLFVARLVTLPFSLYFFLVFLPFFPLALPLTAVFGAGLLLLAPIGVLWAHLFLLREDFVYLNERLARTRLLPMLAAATLLPLLLLGAFQYHSVHFRRGFDHVYYPDLRGGKLELNLPAFRTGLDSVRQFKSRATTPYLSRLFYWMALGNLTLPDAKLELLERIYFDKQPEQNTQIYARRGQRTTEIGRIVSSEFGDVDDLRSTSTRYLTGLRTESRVERHAGEKTGYRRSWIHLELHNPTVAEVEFSAPFRLPVGATVSDYYLYVNGKKQPGILTERRAALWVYNTIRSQRRDPGIVYYTGPNDLSLRVFPLLPNEKRRTGFEIVHREALDFEFAGRRIALAGMPGDDDQPTYLSANPTAGAYTRRVDYLPAKFVRQLPRRKIQPPLHFLVDASANADLEQAYALLQRALEHPDVAPAWRYGTGVTFVNYTTHTVPLHRYLQRPPKVKTRGGFFLERALREIYARSAGYPEQAPLVIVISNDPASAIATAGLGDMDFLFPHTKVYYSFQANGLHVHSLYDAGLEVARGRPVTRLRADPVLQYDGVDSEMRYLRDSNESTLVFLESEARHPNDSIPSVSDLDTDPWRKGLFLRAFYRNRVLHADAAGRRRVERIRDAFRARLLTPETAFMVVETEAQRRLLLRKQEEFLKTLPPTSGDGKVKTMSEPSLWILLVLLALVWFIVHRRRRFS